jgi:transposase
MSSKIIQKLQKRASDDTKYLCLYNYYYLTKSQTELSTIFKKSTKTIARWIQDFERNGSFSTENQEKSKNLRKIQEEHRDWIEQKFKINPMLYLEDAKKMFEKHFGVEISRSTICRILAERGYSRKHIERLAIQIKKGEIIHFFNEMSCFHWDLFSLLFLDEVSFDNRDLLRTYGYAIIGEKIIHRGAFIRQPRLSLFCFLHQQGILEAFETKGTFRRKIFFECCQKLALSGKVQKFPGKASIWVMDGARIHTDRHIIDYLRCLGIVPVFLPPYCPMYNPLELIFGYVKRYFF